MQNWTCMNKVYIVNLFTFAEPRLPSVGPSWHSNFGLQGEKIHWAWLAGWIFDFEDIFHHLFQFTFAVFSESNLGCSSSSCRCSCPNFFLINEILWILQRAVAMDMDAIYHQQIDPVDRRRLVLVLLRFNYLCIWTYMKSWVNKSQPLGCPAWWTSRVKCAEHEWRSPSFH